MATQTTGNLKLSKPDGTDKVKEFRAPYNSNLDKIDEAVSAQSQHIETLQEITPNTRVVYTQASFTLIQGFTSFDQSAVKILYSENRIIILGFIVCLDLISGTNITLSMPNPTGKAFTSDTGGFLLRQKVDGTQTAGNLFALNATETTITLTERAYIQRFAAKEGFIIINDTIVL